VAGVALDATELSASAGEVAIMPDRNAHEGPWQRAGELADSQKEKKAFPTKEPRCGARLSGQSTAPLLLVVYRD
jgi:hypothetical protein